MTTTSEGAITARIEAVEREIREVHAGLAAGRRTRMLVLLLVIAFVGGITWMLYSLYARVTSEEFLNEMTASAQAHLEENQNIYTDQAEKLAAFARPVVSDALQAQIDQDMPKVNAAIEAERQVLVDNLQPKIKELINEEYGEALASFEQSLVEQFPEAKDEQVQQRVMKNLEVAVQGLVEKYYIEELRVQLEALFAVWEDFPIADAPAEGDEPLTTQLLGYFVELLNYTLTESEEEPVS